MFFKRFVEICVFFNCGNFLGGNLKFLVIIFFKRKNMIIIILLYKFCMKFPLVSLLFKVLCSFLVCLFLFYDFYYLKEMFYQKLIVFKFFLSCFDICSSYITLERKNFLGRCTTLQEIRKKKQQ